MNVSFKYERQKIEVEEARKKYGDAAADMLRDYQIRNDRQKVGQGMIAAAGTAIASGGNPLSVTFALLKGMIMGGEDEPTEEQLRNAGK